MDRQSKRAKSTTTSSDNVVDKVVVSTAIVWRIVLWSLDGYLEDIDILHLLFMSKAFLMENYNEYPGNAVYDLYDMIELYQLGHSVPECLITIPLFEWFLRKLYTTDKAYLMADFRVLKYWYKMPDDVDIYPQVQKMEMILAKDSEEVSEKEMKLKKAYYKSAAWYNAFNDDNLPLPYTANYRLSTQGMQRYLKAKEKRSTYS